MFRCALRRVTIRFISVQSKCFVAHLLIYYILLHGVLFFYIEFVEYMFELV
jgi:hypothetical protein